MLRTFIAVRIPSTSRLRQILTQLNQMGSSLKPVSADHLHLTLKFLGDTPEPQIAEIGEIVSQAAADAAAFELRLVGLGAFPNVHRPDVIWAGIETSDTLITLASILESKLETLGFRRESREFHPHLTLARVKAKPPPSLFQLLDEHGTTDVGTVHISSVELFQSELQRGGPKYTVLASANFA
ncbi:MAG: RNA 2',3'-cyclic phosphodiesterase [Planctomycetales bacterium]|nr:RNA 2',3'-cyclic phosphodiesterase [Planctomycetales bacterium]